MWGCWEGRSASPSSADDGWVHHTPEAPLVHSEEQDQDGPSGSGPEAGLGPGAGEGVFKHVTTGGENKRDVLVVMLSFPVARQQASC